MMKILSRRVLSGNYPLYRLVSVGVLISGLLQIILRDVPPSVAHTSPAAFDYIYLIMQAVGAAIILCSFLIRRAVLSLNTERVGGIAVATAGLMYFTAVWIHNTSIPTSGGTWVILAFAAYLLWRTLLEIPRELRVVEATAELLVRKKEEAHVRGTRFVVQLLCGWGLVGRGPL